MTAPKSSLKRRRTVLLLSCMLGVSTLAWINSLQRGFLSEYTKTTVVDDGNAMVIISDQKFSYSTNNETSSLSTAVAWNSGVISVTHPQTVPIALEAQVKVAQEDIIKTASASAAATMASTSTARVDDANTGVVVAAQEQEQQPQPQMARPVHFINTTLLSRFDGFSASWLQTRNRFMKQFAVARIRAVEDGAFMAFERYRHQMRQTVDWMDCSVEHMSKLWKLVRVYRPSHLVAYQKFISQFTQYLESGRNYTMFEEPLFQNTIAVIAFQQYKGGEQNIRGYQITVSSLAVTMESLRRAGFGRVVVVGLDDNDREIVETTFRYLQDNLRPVTGEPTFDNTTDTDTSKNSASVLRKNGTVPTVIDSMEVAFVRGDLADAKTIFVKINVPKAALTGLQKAFKAVDANKTHETNVTPWLGTVRPYSYWKYVYLTEPDSILHMRPSSIPQLKAAVDQGNVLLPHRLQPLPHESDFGGINNDNFYLRKDFGFEHVFELYSDTDVCCDEQAGPEVKPGKHNFGRCNNFWYLCGFNPRLPNNATRHERLHPYQLMRLPQGTGIVSLAGSEHGRRCFPEKNAFCKPNHKQAQSESAGTTT